MNPKARIIILVVVSVLFGIGVWIAQHPKTQHAVAVVVKAVPQLTDAQKIDLLRQEAKKQGMAWDVFCTKWYEDEPESFLGAAHRVGERADDLHDRWLESAPTQADAAYALYLSIQGAPTHPARPPDKPNPHRPYICPMPRLHGE